jgi:hypothetical protein
MVKSEKTNRMLFSAQPESGVAEKDLRDARVVHGQRGTFFRRFAAQPLELALRCSKLYPHRE